MNGPTPRLFVRGCPTFWRTSLQLEFSHAHEFIDRDSCFTVQRRSGLDAHGYSDTFPYRYGHEHRLYHCQPYAHSDDDRLRQCYVRPDVPGGAANGRGLRRWHWGLEALVQVLY